jgi:hypothetical protein
MTSSQAGCESESRDDVKTYAPIARSSGFQSPDDTTEATKAVEMRGKGEENDCTLVRSFTPSNRQLALVHPPDGGVQAWLQGMCHNHVSIDKVHPQRGIEN